MKEDSAVISSPVAEWLKAEPHEFKEFILEFHRPRGAIKVERGRPNQRVSWSVTKSDASQDEVNLENSIRGIIHRDVVWLKTAGAISFLANAEELNQIASLPSVKKIRFNRHFHVKVNSL